MTGEWINEIQSVTVECTSFGLDSRHDGPTFAVVGSSTLDTEVCRDSYRVEKAAIFLHICQDASLYHFLEGGECLALLIFRQIA